MPLKRRKRDARLNWQKNEAYRTGRRKRKMRRRRNKRHSNCPKDLPCPLPRRRNERPIYLLLIQPRSFNKRRTTNRLRRDEGSRRRRIVPLRDPVERENRGSASFERPKRTDERGTKGNVFATTGDKYRTLNYCLFRVDRAAFVSHQRCPLVNSFKKFTGSRDRSFVSSRY